MSIQAVDRYTADIPAEKFGLMPDGIDCNSPAFNIGHLAIYPDRILEILDRADLAHRDAQWEKLFEMKAECRNDPDGTIYPHKDALVSRFRERQEIAIRALKDASPETLTKTNPFEPMRERFPTVGAMATFLLSGHPMLHLGQISTWRRCMGMPRLG